MTKLSKDATKDERALAHLVKMRTKKNVNAHNRDRQLERREFVFANQSQHHENYGETPSEQAKRMLGENNS